MELCRLTINELQKKLRKKEVSSLEATEGVFKRIEEVEEKIHAFVTLTKEEAFEQARAADKRIAAGEQIGPLDGIPISLKDIFVTKDILTTCSSKILNNFIPPYDGTVVKKVKDAGAVILGKTNMDEFAMGSSNENSYFGVTRNPWNLTRVPGGSSGGSAAGVAADECIGSLGTDTGGSIRLPAACCGVVGMKPTYGRVSRYGIVAFASSLDQVGPLTKDVTDCAILMNIISGYDPMDSTSIPEKVPDYTRSLVADVKGIRIGVPKEYFIKGTDPEVEAAVQGALRLLEGFGAEIKEVSLPHAEYGVAAYYLIAPAEASSNLARYDGVKYGYRSPGGEKLLDMYRKTKTEGFGPEVKRRIMLGTYALSAGYYDAYYLKAQRVRTLIRKDFESVFHECDVIVTPTAPTPAFKLGEKTDDPLQMYLTDIFTISCNLAGIPGLSLPCGFSKEGLPIGLQILGGFLKEDVVIRVAYTYENNTDWHQRRPEGL
jgi:aspartyl-tRNA(Asn)/glutamyl-tRNA(Gln) amidotransferase subunit A